MFSTKQEAVALFMSDIGRNTDTQYVSRTSRYPVDITNILTIFDKKMFKVNKKRGWSFVLYVNLVT